MPAAHSISDYVICDTDRERAFAEALEAGRELMREADARRAEIVSDLAGRGAHQDNEIDAKETGHAALETQN